MNDYKISGIGTIGEGEYNIVKIAGTGKASGKIKAVEIHVSGIGKFEQDVEAELIKVSGTGKFDTNIKCTNFKLSGALSIEGNLDAENINISGAMNIKGDVNTDKLYVDTEASTFNNIYGDDIYIRADEKYVKVNEIEATKIEVRNVRANRLSGSVVEVYGFSSIDTIEYSESLTICDSCDIKQIIKL